MKRILGAALLALTTACSGSSPSASVSPEPTSAPAPVPTFSPCPEPPRAGFRWPAPVPQDLPQPPSAVHTSTSTTAQGVTIVKFTTASSLQQSVLFVVRETQKAGYTLGRGDAEPAEADAPFGKGDVAGLYKMLVRGRCDTDWLVAVTKARRGTSPLLPTTSPGPSSKPLPFG